MLAGVDTNLVGLLLIGVATAGFILFLLGRRRKSDWMARLGGVTVVVVFVGLMLVIASAVLANVGD